MHHQLVVDLTPHDVWLSHIGGEEALHHEGRVYRLKLAEHSSVVIVDGDVAHIHHKGRAHVVRFVHPLDRLAEDGAGSSENEFRAPMPGSVVAISVAPGDKVSGGQTMMVIESMKLETAIQAPRDGVVEMIHFRLGATFDRDAVLITLAPEDA